MAEKKKIFITGASGQTGYAVLSYIVSHHKENFEICAGVTQAHVNEPKIQQLDVKCAALNAEDKESVKNAFQDVHSVFIIPSSDEKKVDHAKCYIDAAAECKVQYVLLLSMIGADDRNYLFANQFRDMEEYLTASSIHRFTILRANFYMQNLLLYKDQIKNENKLPLPTGDGKFSPIDVEDVGRTAAVILNDFERHSNKLYNLTGPESLNGSQMAASISEALGKSISFENIDREEARTILLKQNVPENEVRGIVEFYDLVKNYQMNVISHDVKNLTHQNACSIKQFFEKHKSQIMD
jgi:uncharacterized protein YbjT (DUF2867 family)